MTSWPPGRAFVMGIKMERSAAVVSQPQQGIGHNAPSSRSRTFTPAPSASLFQMKKLMLIMILPSSNLAYLASSMASPSYGRLKLKGQNDQKNTIIITYMYFKTLSQLALFC